MSSEATYQLRDIVLLMNEALDSFQKCGNTMTSTFEKSGSMIELMENLKHARSHYERGMFRLGLAYAKLAKGAKLEEEKEKAKPKER